MTVLHKGWWMARTYVGRVDQDCEGFDLLFPWVLRPQRLCHFRIAQLKEYAGSQPGEFKTRNDDVKFP